jgi:hypothetical protein
MSIAVQSTTNYAYTLTEPVSTTPFTLSCWAKLTNLTNTHVVVAIDTPSTSGYNVLGTLDFCGACTSPADVPRARSYDGTHHIANASTSYTTGSWVHICGVFTSTSSRFIYYNGGNKVQNTGTDNATPSELVICRSRRNSAQGPCVSGDFVAEVAVWDSALSDSDVVSLAGGTNPKDIAGGPVAYWPLTETTTNEDQIGSNDLTENAITYSSDHPSIDPPGGIEYTRTINESLGISDTNLKDEGKNIFESLGIVDTNLKDEGKNIFESLGIVDIESKNEDKNIIVTDSLGITDTISRVSSIVKTLAESLGITDSAVGVSVLTRAVVDSIGLSDIVDACPGICRILADDVGVTDAVTKLFSFNRVIADDIAITDTLTRLSVMLRSISENFTMTDEIVVQHVVPVVGRADTVVLQSQVTILEGNESPITLVEKNKSSITRIVELDSFVN